ncbi:unnamed protein product, partial [Polarella glacialis]
SLTSLGAEMQLEVVAGGLPGATNPNAVLLSRIRRIKSGQPIQQRSERHRRDRSRSRSVDRSRMPFHMPFPPPLPPILLELPAPDHELEAQAREFLDNHGISADECQSLWELSAGQQRQVISKGLDCSEDPYDALMSRIRQVMADGALEVRPSTHCMPLDFENQVEDFLQRHGIAPDGCQALRELPWEQQQEVIATDLKGAKKPTAVLLSRISRVKARCLVSPGGFWPRRENSRAMTGVPSDQVEEFLSKHGIDQRASEAFRELRPDLQQQVLGQDFSQIRNASAMLMSRIRAVSDPTTDLAMVCAPSAYSWPL